MYLLSVLEKTLICRRMSLLFLLFFGLNICAHSKGIIKPHKKWRKYIDCDVCRIGMAWLYKLNDELREQQTTEYGEYELENLMHQLCRSQTTTGSWIRTFDIIHNRTSGDVELKYLEKVSECSRDCKTIEMSCKHLIDLKAEQIIKFIWNQYNNGIYNGFDNEFIQKMCTKECDKYLEWRKSGKLEKDIEKYDIGNSISSLTDEERQELEAQKLKKETIEQVKDNIVRTAERFRYTTSLNKQKRSQPND